MTVGAFQKERPLQRGRKEWQDVSPLFGIELSAGEQQTELVLWDQNGSHGGGHALTHDFSPGWAPLYPGHRTLRVYDKTWQPALLRSKTS
jgi:hypothetical protein